MSLAITGLTLSVEFGDTSYGAGTKSFASLHARCPAGGAIPLDDPNQTIEAGLNMYLTAWTTLMMSRLAVHIVTKEEYNLGMERLQERIAVLKARLHQP